MATYIWKGTVVTAPDDVIMPPEYEPVKPKRKAAPRKKAAPKED